MENGKFIPEQTRERNDKVYVLEFMERQIRQLKRNNRLGTALNYERARNSLKRFLGGTDIPFRALNESLIQRYNTYLIRRGLLRNSISFHMRIWRAVYNKAAAQRLTRRDHPFHHVYTGIDRTGKRAIDERLIARLKHMRLPKDSPLEFARDLFIFSYCTRGMAFIDVAHLRKSEIRDNTIRYARQKTQQPLMIRIEGPIQRIIEKYRPQNEESPYLFPILKGDDPEHDFRRYRNALNNYNRLLSKLSEKLPEDCRLTSYTSRHSWATAARKHNIPLSVISAGLGHNSQKTTEIYLATLESSIIDAANQELIRRLR